MGKLRLVPILGMLVLLAGTLSAQEVRLAADLTEPLPFASTSCVPGTDSTPDLFVIHTHKGEVPTLTLTHELTHVALMAYLGCHKAVERYNDDPRFRFLAELDAYCAEARAQQINGELPTHPLPESLVPFNIYMFLAYGRSFGDLDDTRALISERCPILNGF